MFKLKVLLFISLFISLFNVNVVFAETNQYLYGENTILDKSTGEIYYTEDGLNIKCDSLSKDGLLYDSTGKQINTLSYIYDKYKVYYEDDSVNYIEFDNSKEFDLFINYLQLYKSNRQGHSVIFHNSGNKVKVKKTELCKIEEQPSEEYLLNVRKMADSVDLTLDFEDKVQYLSLSVAKNMDYDLSYTSKDIVSALNNKRGVCYHYAKYLHDVLNEIGIYSEYVIGQYENENSLHVWLKLYDENNKAYYRDPTKISTDYKIGLFPTNVYESYFGYYKQAGLV